MCERCELPVQEPRCDLQLEKGWQSYGWRRGAISDGGWSIGRAKKEGRNSYGEVWYKFYRKSLKPTGPRYGRVVMQLHPSLDLLHHGPSVRACECRNAGRQCTGCYCWGKRKNKGWLMLSPSTTRGLLGIFPRGADPPANDRRAKTLPVRSPTSLSLRAISAARSGGRSARGGASGCRGLREERRNRKGGEAESEGWSGRSDDASDAETEEEGWRQDTMMALPWVSKKAGQEGYRSMHGPAGATDRNPLP